MSHLALADFLDELEHERLLARVGAEVSPELELAAVARRAAYEQGPALLFTKVAGHESLVATNLLATPQRILRALGVKTVDEVRRRAAELLEGVFPGGWLDVLRLSPGQSRWAPRTVKTGACQQVVRLASDVDLTRWFRLRAWPEDEAPSLTAVPAFVQAPDDSWRSLELCSASLLDRHRLALAWEPQRGLARLWHEHARRGDRLPVALALGGLPAQTLVAAAPLAAEMDRWTLCGWLRERSCDLVRCRTLPIDVPADAEIVVEGYLDPAAPHPTLPRRVEATGRCSIPTSAVTMQVTAVTHRTNPVQVLMQPHRPPHELAAIRQSMLEVLKPLLLAAMPGVVDFQLPDWGGCRHVALVSIRKTRSHQGRQTAGALWSLEPFMFARLLVIVDEDADLADPREVLRRICDANLGADVFTQPATRDDTHTSASASGALLGIDATRKIAGEGGSPWPGEPVAAIIEEHVNARWAEYGLGGPRS